MLEAVFDGILVLSTDWMFAGFAVLSMWGRG